MRISKGQRTDSWVPSPQHLYLPFWDPNDTGPNLSRVSYPIVMTLKETWCSCGIIHYPFFCVLSWDLLVHLPVWSTQNLYALIICINTSCRWLKRGSDTLNNTSYVRGAHAGFTYRLIYLHTWLTWSNGVCMYKGCSFGCGYVCVQVMFAHIYKPEDSLRCWSLKETTVIFLHLFIYLPT